MTCNACNRAIYDRLMSKTSPDNKIWHSDCLKCCECNKLLDSKYFETSGKLYCRNDYLTFFGPSCFGCAGKITDDQYFFSIKQHSPTTIQTNQSTPGETPLHHQPNLHRTTQTLTAPNNNNNTNSLFFHDKCFACSYCTRPLQKGEKYCILDTNLNMPKKSLMICHDICAIKYHSASTASNTTNNSNNLLAANNNLMHNAVQQMPNPPTPRAKRGRMKQSSSVK